MKPLVLTLMGTVLALSSLGGEARASRFAAPLSFSEGIESADLIVLAEAVSEATRPHESGFGLVMKDMVFRQRAIVKGTHPTGEMAVSLPGWPPSGPQMLDGPMLVPIHLGRSYLLLLKPVDGGDGYQLAEKYGDTENLAIPAAVLLAADELDGLSPEAAVAACLASCFLIGDATLADEALGHVDRETNASRTFLTAEAQARLREGLVAAYESPSSPILRESAALALCHLGDWRGAAEAIRILKGTGDRKTWARAGGAVAALLDRRKGAALCDAAVPAALANDAGSHPRLVESLARNCPGADLGDTLVEMTSSPYRLGSVYTILSNNWVTLSTAQSEAVRNEALKALHDRDDLGAVNLLNALRDPAAIPGLEQERDRIEKKDFGTRHTTQRVLLEAIAQTLKELADRAEP